MCGAKVVRVTTRLQQSMATVDAESPVGDRAWNVEYGLSGHKASVEQRTSLVRSGESINPTSVVSVSTIAHDTIAL